MRTPNLLISALLVWSVCHQHAADGRYVDADEFTTLVAEVAEMKEERLEFNNRITELETKLSTGEAKLSAIEDKLSVTEAQLAGTEEKLRIVENKLGEALSRIDELEKHSESWHDMGEVTGPHVNNTDTGNETDMERNLTVTTNKERKGITRERSAADKVLRLQACTGGKGQQRIVRTTEQQIAFSVYLDRTLTGLGTQHTIKFDGVRLNAGNAYDAIMGVFICPVSGVYVFQSALMAPNNAYIITEMVKDGAVLVEIYAAGSSPGHGFDQGFNSVITTCNQGEHVWVRVSGSAGTSVYGGRYPTFSGYLLWEI